MNETYLLLDIETIPRQDIDPPEFDASTVKLGNIKDETKRQEKIEKARIEYLSGLDKKMSVTSELCQAVSLAYLKVDIDGSRGESDVFYAPEKDIDLVKFWGEIYSPRLVLITWNGKSFDIPVLWKRSIFYNQRPSFVDFVRLTRKYDIEYHMDLMHIWNDNNFGSMQNCADFLGIECKSDFDGSMVYDAWKAGEHEKIKTYNMQDVDVMYQICKRIGIF